MSEKKSRKEGIEKVKEIQRKSGIKTKRKTPNKPKNENTN